MKNGIITATATTNNQCRVYNEFTSVWLLDKKIEDITAGLQREISNGLYSISKENALIITDYIQAMRAETNLSDNYRRDVIKLLYVFCKYEKKDKPFRLVTRMDVLAFLDSFRRPEASDPMHKWIGTYNTYRIHLLRFFKWLYSPDIEPDKRPRPEIIQNISKLRRKEKSIYKPTDLWTPEDDLLFLKYCPSKRNKCYHAMAYDTGCRPHELLKLRIRDLVFKLTPDKKQYAEILVNGKTGSRHIPLIDSIPYVKDYLDHEHPHPGNSNAILLCGIRKSLGKILDIASLNSVYDDYKKETFPKLIENPNVPSEDKGKIRELLKKPWNPYIRRHSGLTEKASNPEIAVILENYAGWVPGSNMKERYIHLLSNQASNSILQAYGVIPKEPNELKLRVKQCPQCNEPNTPDSKFCAKCRMVLRYDGYQESVEKQRENENKLAVMEERFNSMQSQMQSLITALGSMDQSAKNTFAKQLFENGVYLNQRSAN